MELVGMSEGMRALFEGHKKLHESVLKLQTQIEEEEAAYLEETPHGNIIRGWDGFIDAKQPRKDAATKKVKPYSDAEHLFSSCCFYSTLASEPTADLIDPTIKEESTSSRRKLSSSTSSAAASSSTVTTATSGSSGKAGGGASSSSSGSAGATSGTPVASKLQRGSSFSERKSSIGSTSASGKGKGSNSAANSNSSNSNATSSTSTTGKASKLKKRKREKLESQESVEILDDAGTSASASANPSAPSKSATMADKEKDFLDVF